MSHNFVVKQCHKNVRMTSVLFKMADINVGYLKIKMQSLMMPSSDPRDRIVYPIHKLMIDSYIQSSLTMMVVHLDFI